MAGDKVHGVFPILHAIKWLAKNENYCPDIILMLLPTAPFRRSIDIDKAIELHLKSKGKMVIGVCEEDKRLLHFRYIRNQKLVPVIKTEKILNVQRQDLERIYYVNGAIYVANTKNLLKEKTFHTKNAIPYIMDEKHSTDINTSKELRKAKLMLKLKNMIPEKKPSIELQKIANLQVSANSLLNWLFQKKSLCLNKEPYFVIDLFRNQILNTYHLYPEITQGKNLHFKKFIVPKNKRYKPISRLVKGLNDKSKYFIDVLIHGSIADNTVIKNWSDVDILAIVKESVFENINDFLFLRNFLISIEDELYKFNSFQHHGIQFISEADLKFYPEYFLPLEVLKFGKSLIKENKIKFFVRDSIPEKENRFYRIANLFNQSSKTGVFKHHARKGIYLEENFRNKKDNFYQLKCFIGYILLLPTLFIELVDKPIYKKHSFEKIKKYFNNEKDLKLINECEEIRYLFKDLEVVDNTIPNEVIKILGNDYFKRANILMKKLVKKYEIYKSTQKA